MINKLHQDINVILVPKTEIPLLLNYLPWTEYAVRKLRKPEGGLPPDGWEVRTRKFLKLLGFVEIRCRQINQALSKYELAILTEFTDRRDVESHYYRNYGIAFGFSAGTTEFLANYLEEINFTSLLDTLDRRLPMRLLDQTPVSIKIKDFILLLTGRLNLWPLQGEAERAILTDVTTGKIFHQLTAQDDTVDILLSSTEPWVLALAKDRKVTPTWLRKYLKFPKGAVTS